MHVIVQIADIFLPGNAPTHILVHFYAVTVCAVAHHYVFPIPSALEYDQTRLDERYRPGYQNNEPLLDKVSNIA